MRNTYLQKRLLMALALLLSVALPTLANDDEELYMTGSSGGANWSAYFYIGWNGNNKSYRWWTGSDFKDMARNRLCHVEIGNAAQCSTANPGFDIILGVSAQQWKDMEYQFTWSDIYLVKQSGANENTIKLAHTNTDNTYNPECYQLDCHNRSYGFITHPQKWREGDNKKNFRHKEGMRVTLTKKAWDEGYTRLLIKGKSQFYKNPTWRDPVHMDIWFEYTIYLKKPNFEVAPEPEYEFTSPTELAVKLNTNNLSRINNGQKLNDSESTRLGLRHCGIESSSVRTDYVIYVDTKTGNQWKNAQTNKYSVDGYGSKVEKINVPAGVPIRVRSEITTTSTLNMQNAYYHNNNWNTDKTTVNQISDKASYERDLTIYTMSNLKTGFNQVTGKVSLSWDKINNLPSGYKYHVYRTMANDNGTYSGNREELGNTTNNYFEDSEDRGMVWGKNYRYEIVLLNDSWLNNGFKIPSDPQTLTGCSFVESKVSTKPDIKLHLTQDMNETEKIKLSWNFNNTPEKENDLKFRIHRIENDGTLTTDYGSVSAHRRDGNATFIDEKPASKCDIYKYYVQLDLLNNSLHFFSDTITAQITACTTITSLDITKGSLDEGVRVTWRVHQVGTDATTYKVKRRFIGTTEWSVVHTTKGTDSEYTFLDTNTETGRYYEYCVEAYGANCEDNNTLLVTSSRMESGFGQVTGTISGRVTFDTGTAVNNVKVNLLRSDDEKSDQTYSYARHILEPGNTMVWRTTAEEIKELFGAKKDWSIQMWVRPDNVNTTERLFLLDIYRILTIHLQKTDANASKYNLRWTNCYQDNPDYNEKVLYDNIPANEYIHISVVHKQDTILAYINGELKNTVYNEHYDYDTRLNNYGGNLDIYLGGEQFTGYMDEIRIWEKALSAKEVANNYGRILSGREDGLKVYWPFDEGLDEYAFDISRTNGVSNSNHPDVSKTKCTQVTPTSTQLGLYGMTNEKGEYIIRGIPFTGSGTGYTVMPEFGVHEFSPSTRTGFISSGSMALNNYDFSDISSFKVSGRIYYAGTDVPVDSVQFAVDGNICMAEDEIIYSNANGEYTISVPIGFHYITASRAGHSFEGDGRYPLTKGETFEFRTDQTINFTDNTLVHFGGRLTGGEKEGKEPLGYGKSKNTIGQATLQLEALDYPQCRLNVVTEKNGLETKIVNNKENLHVDTNSDLVNSESWRAGGDDNATKNIYIKTDPKTGEFSAMLPPLRYRVTSVKFEHNSELDNAAIFQNLAAIDMTKVQQEEVPDTCWNDDHTNYDPLFKCVRTMRLTYRSPVEFDVYQIGSPKGFFGEDSVTVTVTNEDDVTLPVATIDNNDKVNYLYGYPIFKQGEQYEFNVRVYEPYVNYDDDKEGQRYEEALADSVITMDNEMGELVMVAKEDTKTDSVSYQLGDIVHLEAGQLQLDSLGTAVYKWQAGFPNLTTPYTRTMNIFTKVGNSNYGWKDDYFEGIVFGCIPTGNNFVTAGPDNVIMVLRDPPGANSTASWQSDTITVHSEDTNGFKGAEESLAWNWGSGMEQSVYTGVGVMTRAVEVDEAYEVTAGEEGTYEKIFGGGKSITLARTENITTSDGAGYVGSEGDIYIGFSKNYIFGGAMIVGLFKQEDGSYALDMQSGMSMGDNFNTFFRYTQKYIENTQLPNLKMLRNRLLTHVNSATEIPMTVTGPQPIFYTTLSPDDPRYGSSNCDKTIWGSQASDISNPDDGPSYSMRASEDFHGVDSIAFYNFAIDNWIKCFQENEKDKVTAFSDGKSFDKNFSWDQGTTENFTSTSSNMTWDYSGHNYSIKIFVNWKTGAEGKINGVKTFLWQNNEAGIVRRATKQITDSEESKATFAYTLNDNSRSAALSVDVFKSPNGWGPIFRTRGGQTNCPYEGEERTRYYNPGTLLNYATMKMDNPKISIPDNMVLDVPSGREATLEVVFTNESETQEPLLAPDLFCNNNPNGLQIFVDGNPITNGVSIPIDYGVPVKKTLTIRQADTSILDYEDIELALYSTCEFNKIYDTAKFSIHFTQSAPEATFTVNKTTVNSTDVEQAPDKYLTVTAKDFDRSFKGFKSVRVKYRFIGDNSWITAHEFFNSMDMVPNGKLQSGQSLLPENKSSVSHSFALPTIDGHYMVCVETTSMYGNQEVTWQSEEKEVVKDTHGPMLLGQTYPNTGILIPTDDIHIKFNEPIRANYLTKAKNFNIVGNLSEAPIDHQVSLQLNGQPIKSDSYFPFYNTSSSASLWLYRQSGGTIMEHGNSNGHISFKVDDNGRAMIVIDGKQFTGENVQIPANQWVFLTMNYVHTNVENYVDMQLSYDDKTLTIFDHQVLPEYSNSGQISIGEGLKGAIQELSVWSIARTPEEQKEYMNKKLPIHKNGLAGYWPMNEGHGTTVTDIARGNNFYLDNESWNLNNQNLAAHLDGTAYIKANVSTESLSENDNYMLSMWFKGDKDANANATLFSLTDRMSLEFDSIQGLVLHTYRGQSSLNSEGDTFQLTKTNYSDGLWHHFALNVRRGTSANVFIDGAPVMTLNETKVPAFAAANVFLGARERNVGNEVKPDRMFKGDIDEFTVWKATVDGTSIAESRYYQNDSIMPSLLVYYPMEHKYTDSNGVTHNDFSLVSGKASTTGEALTAEGVNVVQAVNAPPLKTMTTLESLDFDFTASEDEIYITLKTLPARMHGNLISFTVQGIPDVNGNLSDPITWTAKTDYSTLKWNVEDELVTIDKERNVSQDVNVTLSNTGKDNCYYNIISLPSWMTVDYPEGSITVGEKINLTFTIKEDAPLGSHMETIYATNEDNIHEALTFDIFVKGNTPSWNLDASMYENKMNVIGQIFIKDKICTQKYSCMYAFIGNECRGKVYPSLMKTRDAYYASIDVYGNPADEGKPITFRIYDAEKGVIYNDVLTTLNGEELTVNFNNNRILGDYDAPVKWNANQLIEQILDLNYSWNWMSINVQPLEGKSSPANVLGTNSAFFCIKDKVEGVSFLKSGNWEGNLESIKPGTMYKLRMTNGIQQTIRGTFINPSEYQMTVSPGYNWIGSLSIYNLNLNEAFADLQPQKGDWVIGKQGAAYYNGFIWEGTLESINPGLGYIYKSVSDSTKTFRFPNVDNFMQANTAMMELGDDESESWNPFTPVDHHKFADNMIVVATLTDGNFSVDTAYVAAYIDGECRGVTKAVNGIYYITISANPEESGKEVKFRTYYDGNMRDIVETFKFVSDNIEGDPEEPKTLTIGDVTGIGEVNYAGITIAPAKTQRIVKVRSQKPLQSVEVFSTAGVLMKMGTVDDDMADLDLMTIPDGVYLVKAVDNNGNKCVKRIIKTSKAE